MSDAIEAACRAHSPQWGGIDPEIQRYAREQMRAAITAYEAAKGGGVDPSFPTALSDSEVRIWINSCNHEPARQALRQLLAYRVRGVSSALTSPASGAGTREEIKGAVGRETEGWPAETDHVPSPASGERDAPQCCMCGKKGLSTTEGDGGTECELGDGRWVCSQACYDKAVPMHGGEQYADLAVKYAGFDDDALSEVLENPSNTFVEDFRRLVAALRMEGK